MWDRSSSLGRNITQCLFIWNLYYQFAFPMCSILTLNPFLCLVFWLVLVFINSSSGPVYAHFVGDVIAVPLISDNTWSQAKYFDILRAMHVI